MPHIYLGRSMPHTFISLNEIYLMDIAWWPLSKIAEPIYIYVVPINYGSNVFNHDHSMTRIKVVKYFEYL